MFTTYLLYYGETDRLALEFQRFNEEYQDLLDKSNTIMKKPERPAGTLSFSHHLLYVRYELLSRR